MKYQIMVGMLFTLLANRKVSAGYFAEKYGCSVRSIYRYAEEMSISGVPVDFSRGRQGGIYISDSFKLPKGMMTKEEYTRTLEAMIAMNEQIHDENLKSAIEKFQAQVKSEKFDASLTGNLLVDGGSWGDSRYNEKLGEIERAIEKHKCIDIDYFSREGEHTKRRIEPHLLVYKQNIWYVYAFCNLRKQFRLFKIGRIRSFFVTDEPFQRKPFKKEDIPLSFWNDAQNSVNATFEIDEKTLPFAEEWLGIENIQKVQGKYLAEITLPDDDSLVKKILSAGVGFRVVAPSSLSKRVKDEARKIAESYN